MNTISAIPKIIPIKIKDDSHEKLNYEITIVNDYRSVSNKRREANLMQDQFPNFQAESAYFSNKENVPKNIVANSTHKIDIKKATEGCIENNPQIKTMSSKLFLIIFRQRYIPIEDQHILQKLDYKVNQINHKM